MTRRHRKYLDDTLSDLDALPLSGGQKAQILRDEAKKFDTPSISDGDLDAYLAERGLLV
jgi:hypothetical protein